MKRKEEERPRQAEQLNDGRWTRDHRGRRERREEAPCYELLGRTGLPFARPTAPSPRRPSAVSTLPTGGQLARPRAHAPSTSSLGSPVSHSASCAAFSLSLLFSHSLFLSLTPIVSAGSWMALLPWARDGSATRKGRSGKTERHSINSNSLVPVSLIGAPCVADLPFLLLPLARLVRP